MTRRLHVLLATVCLTSAFAAGAVYWTGTFVFGQEDKPAMTQVIGSAAAEDPAPVVVNGRERPDLPHAIDAQGGWSFRYERDLSSDPAEWLKKDAPRTDMRWKGWEENKVSGTIKGPIEADARPEWLDECGQLGL